MTRAETIQFLAFMNRIHPSSRGGVPSTETWHAQVADLPAAEVRAALILLARQQCDITPADVRAEALTLSGRRPVRHPAPASGAGARDPGRERALLVACPWCAAASGEPCTVRGGSTLLRKAAAHPVRLAMAEGVRP